MLEAALVLVAVALAGAACIALAFAELRRVARATSREAGALAVALRRVAPEERLVELSRRAPPGSWEQRLGAEMLAAPSDEARLAGLNEALADLDHALGERSWWARAAARVALASGLVGAIALQATGRPAALGAGAIGAAAALAAVACGRRARATGERTRREVDQLMQVVAGHLRSTAPARRPRPGQRGASRKR